MVKGTEYRWRGADGREHVLTPDAGWSYNPGRRDLGAEAADRMIAKIDAAPPDLAAAAVGQPWNNPLFRRHVKDYAYPDARGDWPVALMPAHLLARIGGKSRTTRLSTWTANKQKENHADLDPGDYARVQNILNTGEVFMEGTDRVIGYLEIDGRLWAAAVKATADGSESYLLTLHRAHDRNLAAARRELKSIDREGE